MDLSASEVLLMGHRHCLIASNARRLVIGRISIWQGSMVVQCAGNLRSLLTRSVIVLVISAMASGESPSIHVASECSGPEGILGSLIVGDL